MNFRNLNDSSEFSKKLIFLIFELKQKSIIIKKIDVVFLFVAVFFLLIIDDIERDRYGLYLAVSLTGFFFFCHADLRKIELK